MKALLVTSPHLNHAALGEGVMPLGGDPSDIAQKFVPWGLLSLAGAAPAHTEVNVADINHAINHQELPMSPRFYSDTARWLLAEDPDLLGFMTEADSYHHVLQICAQIKRAQPRTLTLLGGPHASAVHRETIASCADVDFVIRGEGELALRSLLSSRARQTKLSEVPNLTYRNDESALCVTEQGPLIPNLDLLPFPDLGRVNVEGDDAIFVEIGRGCPFSCNFCFTAPYWLRRHRIKSPARIISELRYLQDAYGRSDFNFTHDLFTTDRKWVLRFCRELAASDINVTWTCSSRTDTLDEEQIDAMRLAGCRNIYFGVETGTPEMQKAIDKNLDLGDARRIIRATSDAGIDVTVGFIAGLPGETPETLSGTLNEALHYLGLRGATVHLFGYSPYRGSAVFEKIEKRLAFDPQFVDFPLGAETHQANCEMMAQNFELFTRYSWLRRYEGVGRSTLRAAEELFPLVNALRPLMLDLRDRGVEPYHLLWRWSGSLARRTRSAPGEAGRYRGTISQLLNFLNRYTSRAQLLDARLTERIRWETLKDVVRLAEPAPRLVLPDGVVQRCPVVQIDRFTYAPNFTDTADAGSVVYAFFRTSDGAPRILRLSSLAEAALALAEKPLERDALATALSHPSPKASRREAYLVALDLIDRLEEVELLAHGQDDGAATNASRRRSQSSAIQAA